MHGLLGRVILTDSVCLDRTQNNGKKDGPRRPLPLHNDGADDEQTGGYIYPIKHFLGEHWFRHVGARCLSSTAPDRQ
jgi:hypothetical protein